MASWKQLCLAQWRCFLVVLPVIHHSAATASDIQNDEAFSIFDKTNFKTGNWQPGTMKAAHAHAATYPNGIRKRYQTNGLFACWSSKETFISWSSVP